MPTVYIETTIPSFYFETRTTPQAKSWRQATRRWWDEFTDQFDLVTSDVVLGELALAPPAKAESRRRFVDSLPLLERTTKAAEVAETYLAQKLVPHGAVADALHVALASIHRIDFLLTWNCNHLANVNKERHLSVLNKRMKLWVPTIKRLVMIPAPAEVNGEWPGVTEVRRWRKKLVDRAGGSVAGLMTYLDQANQINSTNGLRRRTERSQETARSRRKAG